MITQQDKLQIVKLRDALVSTNGTEYFNAHIASALTHPKKDIIYGRNSAKTHPLQAKFAKHPEAIYIHAEIDAIRQAVKKYNDRDFERSTLYIVRIKRPGPRDAGWIFGLAAPCEGCMRAVEAFNIGRVVYTTDTDEIEEMIR